MDRSSIGQDQNGLDANEDLDDVYSEDLSGRRARPIKPLGTTRRLARSKTPTPTNPNPNQRRERIFQPSTGDTSSSSSSFASSSIPVAASTAQDRRPWFPFPNNSRGSPVASGLAAQAEIQGNFNNIRSASSSRNRRNLNPPASSSVSPNLIRSTLSPYQSINRRAISVEPEGFSSSLSRGVPVHKTLFGTRMPTFQEYDRMNNDRNLSASRIEEREEHEQRLSSSGSSNSTTMEQNNSKPNLNSMDSRSPSNSPSSDGDDQKKEKAHFQNVLKAFDRYLQFSLAANNARRRSFYALPKSHRLLCSSLGPTLPGPILEDSGLNERKEQSLNVGGRGFKARLDEIDDRIRRNADFLSKIVSDSRGFLGEEENQDNSNHNDDQEKQPIQDGMGDTRKSSSSSSDDKKERDRIENHEIDKVRSTLKQFVRDWSEEGANERLSAYGPILEALEEEFSSSSIDQREKVRVLVPGAGLGRLAFEIAKKGFTCQGNEFSFYMLLASHFILNKTSKVSENVIYPFIHSSSNWRTAKDMLRPIQIPDIDPNSLAKYSKSDFSMVAGEFVEVYSKLQERQVWNSIVTCFFIDTAHNFVRYLEVINHCLPLGGIWINVGPLLWHFEGSMAMNETEISIELTLEEVFDLIGLMGFQIEKSKTLSPQPYTGNQFSMLTYEYSPEFWVARKVKEIIPSNSDV